MSDWASEKVAFQTVSSPSIQRAVRSPIQHSAPDGWVIVDVIPIHKGTRTDLCLVMVPA